MRLRGTSACSGSGGETRRGVEGVGQTKEGWGRGSAAAPPFDVSHLCLRSSHNRAGKLPPLSGHCHCLAAAAAAAAANSSGQRRTTLWLAAILQCPWQLRMRRFQRAIHYADSQTKQYFTLPLDDTIHSCLSVWILGRGSKRGETETSP